MLPKGLKLFAADIIDENNNQVFWYIVDDKYESAFKRFIEKANVTWNGYKYYFYVAEDSEVEEFVECHVEINTGVYEN